MQLPAYGTPLGACLDVLGVPTDLGAVVEALAAAATRISDQLRVAPPTRTSTANDFGDAQLDADVEADEAVFRELGRCGLVTAAASEERPGPNELSSSGRFVVAFDPLDGSSILGPNLAVGTIAGVWRGDRLVGSTGREAAASVAALYGPRTTLCVAFNVSEKSAATGRAERTRAAEGGGGGEGGTGEGLRRRDGDGDAEVSPPRSAIPSAPPPAVTATATRPDPAKLGPDRVRGVHEFVLDPGSRRWLLSRRFAAVRDQASTFAPGNLRGAGSSAGYRRLLDRCIEDRLSLRYSGGMVPDVLHILALGQGVFFNAPAPGASPKLRLLYEVAPLAFLVEAAGGASSAGAAGASALDMLCGSLAQVTDVCLGSRDEVARYVRYARGQEAVGDEYSDEAYGDQKER